LRGHVDEIEKNKIPKMSKDSVTECLLSASESDSEPEPKKKITKKPVKKQAKKTKIRGNVIEFDLLSA
jgi:hypothetical protein